ncbi:MAG: ABC transporter ATP-binding protein/permease [Candidatus Gracilibacteria bacterium]|nr:ABC transporter ATP-binding protein/permease [Candidatus Gracilibacteria bacterium]
MLKRYKKYFGLLKSCIDYTKVNFYIYLFISAYEAFWSVFIVYIVSSIISSVEVQNISGVYFWTFIFIFFSLLNVILFLFRDSFDGKLVISLDKEFTNKYLSEYVLLDNTKVEEYGTGKMNNIIFTGVTSIVDSFMIYIDIFVQSFAIIYILVLILIKSPNIYYFIGAIFLFLIILFFYWKGLKQLFKIRKRSKELKVVIDGKKVKILMSKFEVLQNQKIVHETDEISGIFSELEDLWWRGNMRKRMFETGADMFISLSFVILFLGVGVGVLTGKYEIANFTLLAWILQILSKYTRQIRMYVKQVFKYYIDIEKLIDVFDTIPKYKENPDNKDFLYKNGDIEFKNVSFSYNEKAKVFEKFNLFLEGGKKYAFVGISGGGKSTLVKLLTGYISPKSGDVIVDNQKLSKIKLRTYYKHIGYLSQEPSVFDGTIKENLFYALDGVPEENKVDEVIKLSKCDFIYSLPKKLETEIGEKGIKLSGGQKQRLAIAKIMLKNPDIIVLDEPTSALDSFNEDEVSEALNNLFKHKTVIVVAHRLQTVKFSDKIFYIEDGKVNEEGSHKELLKLKGKYYRLIELQSGF